MDSVTIDQLVEEFCNDNTSEEVVSIMYNIFEQVMINHPNGTIISE